MHRKYQILQLTTAFVVALAIFSAYASNDERTILEWPEGLSYVMTDTADKACKSLYGSADKQALLKCIAMEYQDLAAYREFEIERKRILVAFGGTGFGFMRQVMYFYVFEREQWNLLFIRRTDTLGINISVNDKDKTIIFRSETGKTLLIQPIEGINLTSVPDEQ